MRFAYIDSHGNEVPIPSVDALALRIELGAIGPETQLYDAQADRWGPAETHEIFHTLTRDAQEEEEFVAPPPPPAPPPPTDLVGDVTDADEGIDLTDPPPPPTARPSPPTVRPSPPTVRPSPPAVPPSPPAASPSAPPVPTSGGGAPAPSLGDLDLDFTLTDAGVPDGPATGEDESVVTEAEPDASEGGASEEVAFDFGAPLELEAPLADEPPLIADIDSAGPVDRGGGMELEAPLGDPMDFSAPPGRAGSGLELEQPMSEFSADAPPSWMEQDGPASVDDGMMSFDRSVEDDLGLSDPVDDGQYIAPEAPPEPAPDRRRAPPQRPPRRKPRKASLAGPILGVLGLGVVGVVGYFGWQAFAAARAADAAQEEVVALPAVTIPDIPADLMPVMRRLGDAALAQTIAELDSTVSRLQLPEEPRNDWLAGVYLANASQFADIEEYWLGIGSLVNRIRDVDTRVFHEQYLEQLAAEEVDAETSAILLARADSGFLATRESRFEAYAEMDDLVNAALNLHAFLLTSEADIAYTPAAGGVSGDPVLEAVPVSGEIGDAMWTMVDAITEALDVLGTLDRVTTDRLSTVLLERIREAGFR